MEYITINSDRSVTVPVGLRKIGVQYDHNVNTIEFVGPRYSSNVDLSTMTIYINYILSDKTPGKYKAENVIIDDQDDSLIRFDWTITRNVTKVSGILSCLVCAKKTDEEGNETNHWNTDIFRLLSVSEGMENDPVIQEQYPDVITSLIQNVEEHDAKLLEFSGLNNRVTDLENNIGELKDDIDNIHIPEQIQSDWTQNDKTAPDYIKNKPFYDNSWVLDTSNVLETNDINSDVGFVLVSNNPDDFYLSDDNINYYGKYYNNIEHRLAITDYPMYDCRAFLYTDDDGNETTICYVVRQENTSIEIYNAGTRYEISNPSIGIWVKHDPQSSKMASIYTKDVHKIDEKYLPDLPKHPDWNQDDETAVDYIKNRPFWTEEVKNVLLEEQTLTIGDEGYEQCNGSLILEVGKTYIVNFNGTEYDCVARDFDDVEIVLIGNGTIHDVDGVSNDEPFLFNSSPDGSIYLHVLEIGDYTVSISHMVNEVHEIDQKYFNSFSEDIQNTIGTSVNDITDGIRTKSIKEAINFPMNLNVYAGTKALEVDGNLAEGSYGSLKIDTLPVFHCYLSESATYSLLVKINDEEISSSITEVSNNHLKIKTDVYGELFFNAGSSQVGINSPISDGSRLYVSLVYAKDYSGVTLLTDDDITNGGTNYNNIENKLTTDKNVSLYLSNLLPRLKYTFIKDIAIDDGSTSIIIKSSDIYDIQLSDTSKIKSRTLFKLGVLPNNFSVMFESCGETSAIPLKNIDDMVLFTWGEIPGTFKIITYRDYVSKAHTLIKNFDTFEANTTYLIWIRSNIVFAFKAETLTEDGLIIS